MVIVFEVAGFALLATAALMFNLLVGLTVCGILLLVLGWLLDAAGVEPRRPRLPRLRREQPDGER